MALPDRPVGVIRWGTSLQPNMLQALGTLAVVSAEAEEVLHRIYWKHAGLNEQSGPIVTDNLNPKRLSEDIIKLVALDKANANILADLKVLFLEFQTLNTTRNHCLHWIWQGKFADEEGGVAVDSAGKPLPYEMNRPAYRQSGILSQEFTVTDVEAICTDLGWLLRRLESHAYEEAVLRGLRKNIDALGAIIRSDGSTIPSGLADLFYPAPWLDNPLSPDSPR